ncbi:MAG: ferrochelatase [Bdellovibrionales bacterium]|nr:ferrochelatase [Bdellovibrionales bacterium]
MRRLLLVNLGSPSSPEPEDVGVYLKQFLMDESVIDINPLARWILVNWLIVPKRKFASSEAYKSVWGKEGSPLVAFTRSFAQKLQQENPEWEVRWAMRYGIPSFEDELRKMLSENSAPIDIVPLYPQWAKSSTGTCQKVIDRVLKRKGSPCSVRVLQDFYDHRSLVHSFVEQIRLTTEEFRPDSLLFSFHGLPEHHIKEADTSGKHCLLRSDCCAKVNSVNRFCYRAQCFATARAIASELGDELKGYQVSFQSRLGRRPWIKPYTDLVIADFVKCGSKRLLVCCPSFVADCLETLEEIQIRLREDFIRLGGEDLKLVPSLNAEEHWVKGFSEMMESEGLSWEKMG